MINYYYETKFTLKNQELISKWISDTIKNENCKLEEITYVFCDDDYLLNINQTYLKHDTFTDIISFDYSVGKQLSGDIFISIDRVLANSKTFKVEFLSELYRVIIHGVLHYCGYKDKTKDDKTIMRSKEDYYLSLQKF